MFDLFDLCNQLNIQHYDDCHAHGIGEFYFANFVVAPINSGCIMHIMPAVMRFIESISC